MLANVSHLLNTYICTYIRIYLEVAHLAGGGRTETFFPPCGALRLA